MRRTLTTDEFRARVEELFEEAHQEFLRTVELHQSLKSAKRELPAPAFLTW